MTVPRQWSLFLVATQFLTRLPVPRLAGFQPIWLTRSAIYFPLVGAMVGVINVGIWWLARHWFPAGVAIGLMMAASLLVTGAFHEDGFADVCDGFGGGATPERILEIMKDSRVGAFGAMGIAMLLGLKWCTLAALPDTVIPLIVVGAHMVSRWCAIGLIWGLRYRRSGTDDQPETDAKAKPLADSLSGVQWGASGLMGALALVPWMAFGGWSLQGGAATLLVATPAAASSAWLMALYFKRRLGGYTGDCLGAAQQVAELAFLLGALAVVPVHCGNGACV
jgi:adenosylcobinamide-GDP ribazoletransferase